MKLNFLKKYKPIIYTSIGLTALYVGDRLDVNNKVFESYNTIKKSVVDACTIDAGEASLRFVQELREEEDLTLYSDKLVIASYEASKGLCNEQKGFLLLEISKSLSSEEQLKFLGSLSSIVYDSTKNNIEDKIKELYYQLKEN
ncbi:hypothetical protein CMO90_00315 [Candidatus Woesearchaeota archaeon]|jgi:hypothetical protein|nr:hypothetical protein [Candidatus Woesearchaeota archaeon]|tara:strand:+ start:71 stop:499 length:429 start_codon:yes stop_codon:yes gene_type:complete